MAQESRQAVDACVLKGLPTAANHRSRRREINMKTRVLGTDCRPAGTKPAPRAGNEPARTTQMRSEPILEELKLKQLFFNLLLDSVCGGSQRVGSTNGGEGVWLRKESRPGLSTH